MAALLAAWADALPMLRHAPSGRMRPLSKGKTMKKIDVEKDYKRSRFLIVAMIIQIVVVFLLLAAYTTWLQW